MELQKLERLLDKYFDGDTSLEEEQVLHIYFKSDKVAEHLEVYRDMFAYFSEAKKDKLAVPISLENKTKSPVVSTWNSWYSIAALLIVAAGVTFFLEQNNSRITAEQQEAMAAYEKAKEALDFISIHFNESSQKLAYITEFGENSNKIFK
ncbi:MAG: hypothetical protein H0X63_03205 [Flavobacteriales bacterium]|nr:hypothetical protein [Flavobacteriales bacterium]